MALYGKQGYSDRISDSYCGNMASSNNLTNAERRNVRKFAKIVFIVVHVVKIEAALTSGSDGKET